VGRAAERLAISGGMRVSHQPDTFLSVLDTDGIQRLQRGSGHAAGERGVGLQVERGGSSSVPGYA
jgi:hypothetical protein